MLAGDLCKEASDLGLPVIGVGFMYPQGYFHQRISSDGWQEEVYENLNWDWKSFDLDRDLKVVDEKVGTIINAINPDLSAFKARGGKLILYHGWNDTAISPGNTIQPER